MQIKAEITPDGILRVLEPETVLGTEVFLTVDNLSEKLLKPTSWKNLNKAFEKADRLDFPRRSQEEIIRELRDFRGAE